MARRMDDRAVARTPRRGITSAVMAGTRTRIVVDDSVLASRIGGRIRVARLAAALTQQQLAAGRYTKAYISALEKGHAKPSMAALDFIAGRLGMPASRFLSEDTRWSRVEADLLLASGRWRKPRRRTRAGGDSAGPVRRADALLGSCTRRSATRSRSGCHRHRRRRPRAAGIGRSRRGRHARRVLAGVRQLPGRQRARGALAPCWPPRPRVARWMPARRRDMRLRLLVALGWVASDQEDHPAAVAYLEEARGLTADVDDRRRASMLSLLAASRAETGDMEGAIRSGLEGLALYRTVQARQEAALAGEQPGDGLPACRQPVARARITRQARGSCTRRTTTVARWHMCSRRRPRSRSPPAMPPVRSSARPGDGARERGRRPEGASRARS